MKRKIVIPIMILIAVLLASCTDQHISYWEIVSENGNCVKATVMDQRWSDYNPKYFYLLLQSENGEIGYASVNAYEYLAHPVGSTTCVLP